MLLWVWVEDEGIGCLARPAAEAEGDGSKKVLVVEVRRGREF